MERVEKGEKYWCVAIGCDGLTVSHLTETDCLWDYKNHKTNNYFHTKKDAEVMAEKIRKVLKGAWVLTPPEGEIFAKKVEAVLNGADVIEMPSKDEIKQASYHYTSGYDDDQIPGFMEGIEYLTSKIVK